MIFGGLDESSESKTVFQQIGGRLLSVGGILLIGVGVVAGAIRPILRYLWEIAARLESIEERLSKIDRR